MLPPSIKKLALKKVKEGESPAQVADVLHISKRTVLYWINPRPKGVAGVKVGRPSKLSLRRKKWVKD